MSAIVPTFFESASEHIRNAQTLIRQAAHELRAPPVIPTLELIRHLAEIAADIEAADLRLVQALHAMPAVRDMPHNDEVEYMAVVLSRMGPAAFDAASEDVRGYWRMEALKVVRHLLVLHHAIG